MYLFNLGNVNWKVSQAIYHALARLGIEGLVICSPKEQYVSVGYFQDTEKEVDLDFLKKKNIPIIRREVGGGTVLLDNGQIFFHLIWNRDNRKFPMKFQEIYEYLSQSPIQTYADFGIKTNFREVNDIVTEQGRKISGLGGANIGNSMTFVGSIILDFDHDTMSRVIKVPDEKFRDKLVKNLKEYVSSIKKEKGEIPPREEVVRSLIDNFEKITGKLKSVNIDNNILRKIEEVSGFLTSSNFIFKKTPKKVSGVKIKSGVEMLYTTYKAKGGLIRTEQEIVEEIIREIGISGDFTMYPKEGVEFIEKELNQTKRRKDKVLERVGEAYDKEKIDAPGVTPEDLTEAIVKED